MQLSNIFENADIMLKIFEYFTISEQLYLTRVNENFSYVIQKFLLFSQCKILNIQTDTELQNYYIKTSDDDYYDVGDQSNNNCMYLSKDDIVLLASCVSNTVKQLTLDLSAYRVFVKFQFNSVTKLSLDIECDDLLIAFLAKQCPNVQSLTLNNTLIFDESMFYKLITDGLAQLKYLKHFTYTSNWPDSSTNLLIYLLQTIATLEELHVNGFKMHTLWELQNTEDYFINIKKLSIDKYNDSCRRAFLSKFKKLNALSLYAKSFCDDDFQMISFAFPDLKFLNLSSYICEIDSFPENFSIDTLKLKTCSIRLFYNILFHSNVKRTLIIDPMIFELDGFMSLSKISPVQSTLETLVLHIIGYDVFKKFIECWQFPLENVKTLSLYNVLKDCYLNCDFIKWWCPNLEHLQLIGNIHISTACLPTTLKSFHYTHSRTCDFYKDVLSLPKLTYISSQQRHIKKGRRILHDTNFNVAHLTNNKLFLKINVIDFENNQNIIQKQLLIRSNFYVCILNCSAPYHRGTELVRYYLTHASNFSDTAIIDICNHKFCKYFFFRFINFFWNMLQKN